MKTYEEWKGNLNEYLQIGDIVDEEMANYFLSVMPPATFTSGMIQIGEPYSHINGRATYSTIKLVEDGWMYCGHCHRGEVEEPEGDAY